MGTSTVIYRDNRGNRRVERFSGGKKTSSKEYTKSQWSKRTGGKSGRGKSSSQFLTDDYVKQQQAKQAEINLQAEKARAEAKPAAETVQGVTRADGKEYFYTELGAGGKVSRNVGVDAGRTYGGRSNIVATSTEISDPTARRIEAGKQSIAPNFQEDATPSMIRSSKREFAKDENIKAIYYDTPEGDKLRIAREDVISPPNKYGGLSISEADTPARPNPFSSLKEGFGRGFAYENQKDFAGRDLLTREKSYQAGYVGGVVGGLFLTGRGDVIGKGAANVAYRYPKVAKGVQTVGNFMSKTKAGRFGTYALGSYYAGYKGVEGYKAYKSEGTVGLGRVGLQTTRTFAAFKGASVGYNQQFAQNLKGNYQLFKPTTKSVTRVVDGDKVTVVSKSRGKLYEFTKQGKLYDSRNVYDKSVFTGTKKPVLTESGKPTNTYRYDGIVQSQTNTYSPSKVLRKDATLYNLRKTTVYKKTGSLKSTTDINLLAGEKALEFGSATGPGGRVTVGLSKTSFASRGRTTTGEELLGSGEVRSQYYTGGNIARSKGTSSAIYSVNDKQNALVIQSRFDNLVANIKGSKATGSGSLLFQQKGIERNVAANILKSKTSSGMIKTFVASTPTNKRGRANTILNGRATDKPVSSIFQSSKGKSRTVTKTEPIIKTEQKGKTKAITGLIIGTKSRSQPRLTVSPRSRSDSLTRLRQTPAPILSEAVAQRGGQRLKPRIVQKQQAKTIFYDPPITTTRGTFPPQPPTKIGQPFGFNLPDLPKPERKKRGGKKARPKALSIDGYSPSLEGNLFNVKKTKDEDLYRSGITLRGLGRL